MRSPTAIMAVAALLLLLLSLAAAAAADTTASAGMEWERMQELHLRVWADWKAGKHGKKRSKEETRRVFTEWKAQHGKKYSSAREEERRYALFKETLRLMDLHEAAFGNSSFYGIEGPFSDLSNEEWRTKSAALVGIL
uniref:Uncharacterized protein n=1 Tax=Avena sativa TaxID=4498 RepID=A0ACD5WYT5_AVESA